MTIALPTIPGYYWLANGNLEAKIVQVFWNEHGLAVREPGAQFSYDLKSYYDGRRFVGPIENPFKEKQ